MSEDGATQPAPAPAPNFARDTVVTFGVLGVLWAWAWLMFWADEFETWLIWVTICLAAVLGAVQLLRIIRNGALAALQRLAVAVQPAPQASAVSTAAAVPDTLAAVKPIDIFGLWANGSLLLDPAGVITGKEAFDHYCRACAVNGVQPMSSNQFGTLLTRRAEASGGMVVRTKANGRMTYRGWRLAGDTTDGNVVALGAS